MSIWEIVAGPLFKLVDKIIPDPQAKAQAQLELIRMQQAGEFKEIDAQLQLAKNQTDINQAEATNPNLFVSGWRPFVGWVCGWGLAYQFLVRPIANGFASIFERTGTFPDLDLGTLITLLFGMLGLGTLRTTEKVKGVASK